MSGSNGPVVTPGKHFGILKVVGAGTLLAGAVAAAIFIAPDTHTNTVAKTDNAPRPGGPPQPFRPPPPDPAEVRPVVAPMAPQPPLMPQQTRRARPSSMSAYMDAAPPTRPVAPAKPGEETEQKIAGMPVLRAETIADAGWYLMPGDKIQCQSNEPLTERTGARFSVNIPEDVRGRDGLNVLVPRGSRATGRVAKGIDNGERRLVVVMDTIEGPSVPGRPTVVVPLGGTQAGDVLGGADLEGNVNTHFWSRLGSVAAYTVLDTVGRIGSGVASSQLNDAINGGRRDGTNVNIGLGGGGLGGGRGLAGRAFDYEINRPPTFDRPQGQACSIYVQSPIDFRKMRR